MGLASFRVSYTVGFLCFPECSWRAWQAYFWIGRIASWWEDKGHPGVAGAARFRGECGILPWRVRRRVVAIAASGVRRSGDVRHDAHGTVADVEKVSLIQSSLVRAGGGKDARVWAHCASRA
jgi:hypothetical protein